MCSVDISDVIVEMVNQQLIVLELLKVFAWQMANDVSLSIDVFKRKWRVSEPPDILDLEQLSHIKESQIKWQDNRSQAEWMRKGIFVCLLGFVLYSNKKIKIQATKKNYRRGPWEESPSIYFGLHMSVLCTLTG